MLNPKVPTLLLLLQKSRERLHDFKRNGEDDGIGRIRRNVVDGLEGTEMECSRNFRELARGLGHVG